MSLYLVNNKQEPIDFKGSDILQRTLQNAKNLLMTKMGEVPYDRYRGFDTSLYDLPFGLFQERLLPEIDRIMMWEPDVLVVSAKAYIDDKGETYIEVTLEININPGMIVGGENGE